MEKIFSCLEGEMPYKVEIIAVPVGEDMVVMLHGGQRPHIGAVAVSIPRPSLKNPETTSATTSIYALVGHKEDELAKAAAQRLASALNKNVVLTAGIHVENIPPEGIEIVEKNCRIVLESLINYYQRSQTF